MDQTNSPLRDGASHDESRRLVSVEDENYVPACQSCRKRKLRCSRDMPTCSQCSRLQCQCLYLTRQKPGLRTGAVDNLSQRLEILERILLDKHSRLKEELSFLDVHDIYKLPSNVTCKPLSCHANTVAQPLLHSNTQAKRKRVSEEIEDMSQSCENSLEIGKSSLPPLPPERLMNAILDEHFTKVQHWIPILHIHRFRVLFRDPERRSKMTVLLHALISASIKYINPKDYNMDRGDIERQIHISRTVVMLNAMKMPSVENLQALIILAFDFMGGGQVSQAWSIIGSLTRTVEYLQLTVEPDEVQRNVLLRPLILLEQPRDWTESEDRRRLFWNIFLLDRICSVTSGWITSLTSDDVHRRLPANGHHWAREETVSTPYFGIWNKSAAKIGNSIAYIPAYSFPQYTDHLTGGSPGLSVSNATEVDVSKLGAFACCVESTESLSQVNSFFLQQLVDFRDRQEVSCWLTRFKELDLRLVHWKMFLPQRWKDPDYSRDVAVIDMDPNLTLAHVTHNTSMILLHQHIAYPPSDWTGLITLPSAYSAEICQLAAVETASISQKYFKFMGGIVNCQFAFCMFVAARALLVHWCIQKTKLSPEFFSLMESLHEISLRWQGFHRYEGGFHGGELAEESLDIAAKYASQLQDMHIKCLNDEDFGKGILSYSDFDPRANIGGLLPSLAVPSRSGSYYPSQITPRVVNRDSSKAIDQALRYSGIHTSSTSLSSPTTSVDQRSGHSQYPAGLKNVESKDLAAPYPLQRPMTNSMPALSTNIFPNNYPNTAGNNSDNNSLINLKAVTGPGQAGVEIVEDELTAMSNILHDRQFLEMDRVITFDGTPFNYDFNRW